MFTPTFHPHYHSTTTYTLLTHPCFLFYFIPIIYLQYGKTPLILAAEYGHLNVVQWLVEDKGADITQSDEVSMGYGVERC